MIPDTMRNPPWVRSHGSMARHGSRSRSPTWVGDSGGAAPPSMTPEHSGSRPVWESSASTGVRRPCCGSPAESGRVDPSNAVILPKYGTRSCPRPRPRPRHGRRPVRRARIRTAPGTRRTRYAQPSGSQATSGLLIYTEVGSSRQRSENETWTFDVCTNTWEQMNPSGIPERYRSGRRLRRRLGPGVLPARCRRFVYDPNTNTGTDQ